MRVFNKKDVFSWSNLEDAKAYIGKPCYFGDCIAELQVEIRNISNKPNILKDILSKDTVPTQCIFNASSGATWGLCLPVDKVIEIEEPKKKYRPFKIEEFNSFFQIGDVLYLRKKEDHDYMIKVVFIGITYHRDQVFISLGNYKLPLQDWFCSYEWNKNQMWQPFGVEE